MNTLVHPSISPYEYGLNIPRRLPRFLPLHPERRCFFPLAPTGETAETFYCFANEEKS